MRIERDNVWLMGRGFFILLAFVAFIEGYPYPALALFVLTLQKIFHEFIHGAAVIFLKGTVRLIHLSGKSYIDFEVPPGKTGFVYLPGFLFDFIFIMSSAVLLIWASGVIFPLIGAGLILAGVFYTTVPEGSDLNLWKYWRSQS